MKTTPKPPTPKKIAKAKERLALVGTLLERVNEDRTKLYAERLELWKTLEAAGVPRPEMADLAKTDVGALKFAFSEDRRKNGSPKEGPRLTRR